MGQLYVGQICLNLYLLNKTKKPLTTKCICFVILNGSDRCTFNPSSSIMFTVFITLLLLISAYTPRGITTLTLDLDFELETDYNQCTKFDVSSENTSVTCI